MVRQLEPALHIDTNEDVVTNLHPHIIELILIAGEINGKAHSNNSLQSHNIWKFDSLSDCFG